MSVMKTADLSPTFVSAGALAETEHWQVYEGVVVVTYDAAGDEDRGIRLRPGQVYPIAAGITPYLRRDTPTAMLMREEVA